MRLEHPPERADGPGAAQCPSDRGRRKVNVSNGSTSPGPPRRGDAASAGDPVRSSATAAVPMPAAARRLRRERSEEEVWSEFTRAVSTRRHAGRANLG